MNSSIGTGISTGFADDGPGMERFARRDRFPMGFAGLGSPGFRPTPADLAAQRPGAQAADGGGRRLRLLSASPAWKRIARQMRFALKAQASSTAPVPGAAPVLRLVSAPEPEAAPSARAVRAVRTLPQQSLQQSLQTEDGSAAATARGAARAPRRLRLAGDDG